MDASDRHDFEVFERAVTSELSAHGMEGSGAARDLRGGVGSGYAAVDAASGVAILAVADGDVTRSTGAISSKQCVQQSPHGRPGTWEVLISLFSEHVSESLLWLVFGWFWPVFG